MNFKKLNLISPILQALEEEQYSIPTPIQEKAIPAILSGRDMVGCAQTGTGKTAAFGVPMLQLLASRTPSAAGTRPIRGLILTPTRELALQIYENLRAYGRHTGLRIGIVFGGVSQNPQVESLKQGVDILVATPGRLNDLIQQKYIDLRFLEIFVLDEADRMLDMGFIHDVKKVISHTPAKKQTLLFSATMPPEIVKMIHTLLKNPVTVEVDPVSSTVDAIQQTIYFVEKENKTALLAKLLEDPGILSALVFTRTKHGADKVVRQLLKAGLQAAAIHGNKSQNARQAALKSFKDGRIRVLVATDIAARGLDIEELSHVVNYDLPNVPETYVHRIGRTGRAGLSGIAFSFCDQEERAYLKDIQKLIGKVIPEAATYPKSYDLPRAAAVPQPMKPKGLERPKAPVRQERASRPEKPVRTEKPMRTERPAKPDRTALTDQPVKPEAKAEPSKAEQPFKIDRPGRTDRPQPAKIKLEDALAEDGKGGLAYSDFTRSAYSGVDKAPARKPIQLKPFELSETPKISTDLWEKRPPSRRKLEDMRETKPEPRPEPRTEQKPAFKPAPKPASPQAPAIDKDRGLGGKGPKDQKPSHPGPRPSGKSPTGQRSPRQPAGQANRAPASAQPAASAKAEAPAKAAPPARPAKPKDRRRPSEGGHQPKGPLENQENSNSLMKPYWLKGK